MSGGAASSPASTSFLELSRRFLDLLGAEGLGDEYDQRQYAIDGREPSWVVLPETPEQAAGALALCAEAGLATVLAGRAARLRQGRPLERLDAVVATARMSRTVEHAAADLTLTVEAGATLAEVNAALAASGQWLPFDPPLAGETTIGGLVATQAAGPSRLAHGLVRERLLGLRAVLPDGTIVKSGGRVVKNVAGYDVHRLLCGSFGTLALVVEATLKLAPLPQALETAAFGADGLAGLAALAIALADSPLAPRFAELLVPPAGRARLVVGFAGTAEEVAECARRAPEIAARFAVAREEAPSAAELLAELESFARPPEGALVLRAGVRRAALAAFVGHALARARLARGEARAHAHAALGVARIEVRSLGADEASRLLEELRPLAAAERGYLVVEDAPASLRAALDPWGAVSAPVLELSRRLKDVFDPGRILAPGRFVGRL